MLYGISTGYVFKSEIPKVVKGRINHGKDDETLSYAVSPMPFEYINGQYWSLC
jgi:hypothetical protein